jgi:hypothetical protein
METMAAVIDAYPGDLERPRGAAGNVGTFDERDRASRSSSPIRGSDAGRAGAKDHHLGHQVLG